MSVSPADPFKYKWQIKKIIMGLELKKKSMTLSVSHTYSHTHTQTLERLSKYSE